MERRLDINLLPPEFLPQPAIRWHPIYLAILYTLSIFLAIYVGLMCFDRISRLEGQIDDTQTEIARLKPFADAYDQAEESVKSLGDLKRLFVYLEKNYVDWPLFLYHLEPNVPDGIWLTEVRSEVVTETPAAPRKPAPAASLEEAAGEGEQPAPEPKVSAPLHTGEIILQGMVNGYSLLPISGFIRNLQHDDYFLDPYLLGSELEEEDDGVVRWFEISLRVKVPEAEGGDTE
jgi:hypothetical protein